MSESNGSSNGASHDKLPNASFPRIKFRAALRIALIFVVYLLAFIALELVSRTLEVYPGIVAWYPPDGLSFALLLTFGAIFLPGFVVASLISSFFIFRFPLPFLELLGWAIFLPLTHGLAAWFLQRRIRIDTQLRSIRDLTWMIVSTIIVSAILTPVSVSSILEGGLVLPSELFWAAVQWWIGEIIGIMVLTPALLIHIMPHVKRFAQGGKTSISFKRPSLKVIVQALAIIAAIYLAVEVNWPNHFHPYFLIGVALIWIAIEHGLGGATLGNVLANFGLTLAVQRHKDFELAELGQLQAMMLVITMTSLIIGIIISDHRQSEQAPTPEIEQRRKMIAYEWISVAVLAMTAWLLEYSYNFFQSIADWENRNQIEGVDETLAMILVVGLASSVFSLRRWREYQVELKKREKAEAELHTLYRELESQVQERTADLSKANAYLQAEITERKQAEMALEDLEAKYRTLVEQLPAITYIVTYGEDTRTTYIGPQVESILGFSAQEWLADQDLWSNQLHPEDRERVLAEFTLRDKLGQPIDVDYRILTRDGRVRWIHDQSVLTLDETGHPRSGTGVLFDITERKQAEEALEQSERRFRALIEHSMEEVSLVSTDGNLIFESPTMRQPLGYPTGAFVGHSLFELFHPDERAAAIKLLEQVSEQSGIFREAVFRLRHQDGSWRWMEGTMINLLDDPAVGAIVINYRDITERKRAEAQIQSSAEELSTLYELSRALADTNDLDQILDIVNRRTVDSVHATFARIALLEGDELIIRSAYPIRVLDHDLLIDSRHLIASMPYCQRVLEQNEPVILRTDNREVSGDERAALLLDFAQTLCMIPLRVYDLASHSSHILGLLMIGESRKDEREPFTEEKMRLARSIGDQAAIAIDKVRLFNDLQRSNIDLSRAYDATIEGWSAALDLRDKETEGHALRVTETTLRLAKHMGFSEQELVQIRRGALLHDIGKMGVPDRILLKPDKLTDEEWVHMRMHPTYAYQMLKPITYLDAALDIPYCHHEKWDGTGYPRQLKGDAIPLAARIFAVVDVYDALTSDRPYRMGWPREKTLDYIREQSGTHFDPQVVDVFLEMIGDENKIV